MANHLEDLGIENELIDRVRLAVTEAVANVVSHAYRDCEPGDVEVILELRRNKLVLVVEDAGTGPLPHLEGGGLGMGLSLIGAVAQKVEIEGERDRGTTVRMTFALPGSDPARETRVEGTDLAPEQ